jgi:hypothetical protein
MLRTRFVGKKYQFCDGKNNNQEILAVEEEEEDKQSIKTKRKNEVRVVKELNQLRREVPQLYAKVLQCGIAETTAGFGR